MAVHLHSAGELEEVIRENAGVVIVDFYAQWCGPCKAVAPKVDDLARNYEAENVKVYKVDIEEISSAPSSYNITMMPTFVFFRGGQAVERVVGADINKLRRTLLDLLHE